MLGTIPSRLSSRANSISQQSSKTAAEKPCQWTEYCSDLYNYELHPDTSLLQSNQTPTQEAGRLPVPKQEVEEAVSSPSAGKCLQEWTTFPLSYLRMEARQHQQS